MEKLDLLETLRDALRDGVAVCSQQNDSEKAARYCNGLRILSTPDALAWRLLEEMAGERVAVNNGGQIFRVRESKTQCFWSTRERSLQGHVADVNGRDLILCLTAALAEQKRRAGEVVK